MLFGRSIHPELFESCVSRHIERSNYSLDLNITSDGHLIVFKHEQLTLAEISASTLHPLPEKRLLMQHALDVEKRDELAFRDKISYSCQFQREQVQPKTVLAIQQQLGPATEWQGLVHRFESSGRIAFGAISYIDIQSFEKHVQVRTFHTFPDTGSIVKSQSTFSINS